MKTTEQGTEQSGQQRWRRAVAVAGAAVLAVTPAGCGAAKGIAHEAENPAAREAAQNMLHAGEQAARQAEQHSGQIGRILRTSESGQIRSYVINEGNKVYTEDLSHSPGAEADGVISLDEVDAIECAYKVLKQTPAGIQEFREGRSVFQRGPYNDWVQTIAENNSGGPLDPCGLFVSALPGASGQ